MRAKAQALNQFLRSMQGPGRAYTLLQLARRMLSYCEAQVALSHPSAFPLAEVAASVLASHPDYAPILLGKLYEVRSSAPDGYTLAAGCGRPCGNIPRCCCYMKARFITPAGLLGICVQGGALCSGAGATELSISNSSAICHAKATICMHTNTAYPLEG